MTHDNRYLNRSGSILVDIGKTVVSVISEGVKG